MFALCGQWNGPKRTALPGTGDANTVHNEIAGVAQDQAHGRDQGHELAQLKSHTENTPEPPEPS